MFRTCAVLIRATTCHACSKRCHVVFAVVISTRLSHPPTFKTRTISLGGTAQTAPKAAVLVAWPRMRKARVTLQTRRQSARVKIVMRLIHTTRNQKNKDVIDVDIRAGSGRKRGGSEFGRSGGEDEALHMFSTHLQICAALTRVSAHPCRSFSARKRCEEKVSQITRTCIHVHAHICSLLIPPHCIMVVLNSVNYIAGACCRFSSSQRPW